MAANYLSVGIIISSLALEDSTSEEGLQISPALVSELVESNFL